MDGMLKTLMDDLQQLKASGRTCPVPTRLSDGVPGRAQTQLSALTETGIDELDGGS